VLRSNVRPDRFVELIVVDNDSSDATKDVVAKYANASLPVRYVVEKRLGLSAARNCAVAISSYDVLMFTDDDVLVPEDWIEGVASMFEDPNVHAVQGRIHLHDALKQPWMEDIHLQFLAVFDYPNADWFTGANMSLRRKSVIEIGGFDETYGPGTERAFGDDTIVGIRMTSKFGRIPIYKGNPVIHHPETNRLTRSALLSRIDKQVDVELAIRSESGIGLPRQALRPVWVNQFLFWAKVIRERVVNPSSPATQAEICARRSVALSLAVQRSRTARA
jgi:glycosyltransferase involved in cell wall biosynthesis